MPWRKRSQARVLALQALCLFDALGDDFDGNLEAFLRDGVNHVDLGWQRRPDLELIVFARELARAAWKQHAQCDALLTQHVPDWPIHRMQPVDRNILRLGLCELLERPDTPPEVVINEAVELARLFGGGDSPAFVNGVLDGVRREIAPPAAAAESTGGSTPATDQPVARTAGVEPGAAP